MVKRNSHLRRLIYKGTTLIINRYKSVVLDILIYESHDKSLTDNSIPEACILLLASSEELRFIVSIALDHSRSLTHKHGHKVVNLKLIANILQGLQCKHHLALSLNLRLRIAAVITRATVCLGVLLAKVVQQRLTATHRTLSV